MDAQWRPDFLGNGYQCLTLELGEDDEGPIVATLVSHAPKPPPPATVAGRARELLHRLRAPVPPERSEERRVGKECPV